MFFLDHHYPHQLGAELKARAISHLEEVSDEGIQAMSAESVIAVLLPTTAYILRLKCPPARKMIESGTSVVQDINDLMILKATVQVIMYSDHHSRRSLEKGYCVKH